MKGKNKIMSTKICPKCNKPIMLPPAISRVDNKTEICSTCGIVEALEVYTKIIEQRKEQDNA